MNEADYEARPLFKMLAGILAVLAWATLILLVSSELIRDRPIWLRWARYIGIASFAIIMTRTVFRKKK